MSLGNKKHIFFILSEHTNWWKAAATATAADTVVAMPSKDAGEMKTSSPVQWVAHALHLLATLMTSQAGYSGTDREGKAYKRRKRVADSCYLPCPPFLYTNDDFQGARTLDPIRESTLSG